MVALGGMTTAYICGGLFALLLGGLGVFLVIHSQRSKKKAQASQTWPSTKGTITSSTVRVDEQEDIVRYVPVVRYTYEVNGEPYEGRQISFGSAVDFGSRQKAEEYLAAYLVGHEVQVFYNQKKPEEAVLKQQALRTTVGLVLGILLLLATACLLCLMTGGIVNLLANI